MRRDLRTAATALDTDPDSGQWTVDRGHRLGNCTDARWTMHTYMMYMYLVEDDTYVISYPAEYTL